MGHPESAGSERSYPVERQADLNLKAAGVRSFVCRSKACTAFSRGGAARLEAAHAKGRPSFLSILGRQHVETVSQQTTAWIIQGHAFS